MGLLVSPSEWGDWYLDHHIEPVIGSVSPQYEEILGIPMLVLKDKCALSFRSTGLPHDYEEGTDVIPHIHLVPTTTGTYKGTLGLSGQVWEFDQKQPTPIPLCENTFDGPFKAHETYRFTFPVSLQGQHRKIGSVVCSKISFTLKSGTGFIFLGFNAHYRKNSIGSRTPTEKG
jgi:hypothetical protein